MNVITHLIAASIGACIGVIAIAFCIAGDDKDELESSSQTNYGRLLGSPERAAVSLTTVGCIDDECRGCLFNGACSSYSVLWDRKYQANEVLKWLRQEVNHE